MNYKRIFSTVFLSAALTLQAAANTVSPVSEAPQWQIDWSGNEARPDWQEPDASAYASFAVMIVSIEEILQPYASQDDLLAIFVGDELRGLASPLVKGDGTVDATRFLLKGYSNESAGDQVVVTMKYYNAQLKQLFSLSESMTLDEDADLGIYDDFVPPFTQGSPKYPVTTTVDVASLLADAGITPAEGDIVAVFVGDECRGVAQISNLDSQLSNLTVFLREEGETVSLKYYDATGQRVFTINDSTAEYVSGDATGDGVVDVSDYIGIANYILGNAPAGFNEQAADVNGDGVVDVSDYIGVANIILYGNVNGK
ncbi:MAG: dockerin type I repeat-containing protein [Prevotella sp.]|nr:dockerin type I repeat-containing protein [Prevotella sp.]